MVERSNFDSSSGVVRMCVRILAWPVAALVSLSKTLKHNCFVLRMGRKTVLKTTRSPVLCNARKRTQDTYREREGACPCVSGFVPWAPSRVDMCALQIFCIIIIKILNLNVMVAILDVLEVVTWLNVVQFIRVWKLTTNPKIQMSLTKN